MPIWEVDWKAYLGNRLVAEQLCYDRKELRMKTIKQVPLLNEEHAIVYHDVVESMMNKDVRIFFLEGPGGSGKTFLYNTLAGKI